MRPGFKRMHHAVHSLGKDKFYQLTDDRVMKFEIDHKIDQAASIRLPQKNPVIDQTPERPARMGHVYFHTAAVEHNPAGIGAAKRLVTNHQIGVQNLAPILLRFAFGNARTGAPWQKFRIARNICNQIKYLRGRKGHRVPLFMAWHD